MPRVVLDRATINARNYQKNKAKILAKRFYTNKMPSLVNTETEATTQSLSTTNNGSENGSSVNNNNCNYKYNSVLTFIEGTLVGNNNDQNSIVSDSDEEIPTNEEEPNSVNNNRTHIPTLEEVAKSSGETLDDKQYISYEVICCTFLLRLVYDGGDATNPLGGYLNATLNCQNVTQRNNLIAKLKARGAQDQLIMLLTGPAGCGKSTCVKLAQTFCHRFCMAVAVAFNNITFYFTSTTGSSAAIFGGMTIHSAAHINKKSVNDNQRKEWEDVRILIIDEISFFKVGEMQKLDKKLKSLTGCYDKPYGGISIVFSGDFHQLQPIGKESDILYSLSPGAKTWENTINSVIFLENSHRFKEDPEYGAILGRMRMGEDTREDREKINTRLIGGTNNVTPPDDDDACYACPTNQERNAIYAGIFKNHILDTHPDVASDDLPPDHTLMIEASMRRKKRKVSQAVHDTVITMLGDDDIRSSEFHTNGAKIEPLLRLYPGSPHMCITNEDLKNGRGNGTLCKCVSVKLKNGQRRWKNWEGKKVWTITSDCVEWVEFEHWPKPPPNVPRKFKLQPRTFSSTVKIPLGEGCDGLSLRVGNVRITQIPVNSNAATTGHKLQGMSKDVLIVNSWNYSFSNWVYVVLSRVRTLSGLYLCKPLDLERQFKVPENLIQFERRMKARETYILNKRQNDMMSIAQQGDNTEV